MHHRLAEDRKMNLPRSAKLRTRPSAKALLEKAAGNSSLYSNTQTATEVARFLIDKISAASIHQISYRTLQMGYELARHNGDQWRELLERMVVTAPEDPKRLVRRLARQRLAVKDQARLFEESREQISLIQALWVWSARGTKV
jgi:hypothetical protein